MSKMLLAATFLLFLLLPAPSPALGGMSPAALNDLGVRFATGEGREMGAVGRGRR